MEKLSSEPGSEAYASHGWPIANDIQPEDCTMALLAAEKRGVEADELKARVVDQKPGSITYNCKACPANLRKAGFTNIQGSLACRATFASDAARIIESRQPDGADAARAEVQDAILSADSRATIRATIEANPNRSSWEPILNDFLPPSQEH